MVQPTWHIFFAAVVGVIFTSYVVFAARRIRPCKCEVGDCTLLKLPPRSPWLCTRPVDQDVHVVGSIARDGLWEPHIVHQVKSALMKYPSALFLDVGAHIGQYTIVAATAGHRVIAFEANRNNCDYLSASVAANKVAHLVSLVRHPALDEAGQSMRFKHNAPSDNTGGWAVERDTAGGMITTTIDESLQLEGIEIETELNIVMKIDIEGSEPLALAGAKTTLKSTKLIFLEWGFNGNPEKIKMAQSLHSMGFRVTKDQCARSKFAECPWDVTFEKLV